MHFEELDIQRTPMGWLSLRRWRRPGQQSVTYEIKLDDEFLMSSHFTDAEIQLAQLGLAALDADGWDVVVGGLGLGYTAAAVLDDRRVRSLVVVEALSTVIGWHEAGLLPLGPVLTTDHRCRLVQGDFFARCADPDQGFSASRPAERVHAILVDIDHAPNRLLRPSHAHFYEHAGLSGLLARLHPGGVFALWSDDPPDKVFLATLRGVFAKADAHVVSFTSLHGDLEVSNTVYVASAGS